jgi:hypothetical protein
MQPCCTRDEGRPLGLGLQGQGPNRQKRRRCKDRGRERFWKRRERTRQVCAGKTNASEPLMTCRKALRCHRNQAREVGLGPSSEGACGLSEWWPAHRRREPSTGVGAERGNLPPRCEGRNPSGGPVRMRVPMRGGGTDRPAVAGNPGNPGGAKGPDGPALGSGQPARG